MHQLHFFPSRTMALYVGRLFLIRSFSILFALVLILQTLDLLGESGKILAVAGNSDSDVWRYVGMRLPQIIETFLPFSVLLGTILTLITLNQNSEVVAMKASGMSAHQVLAPLFLAALLVAGISFAFNERIVTRSTAALSAWQKVEYKRVPADNGVRSNIWVRDGDDLINAETVETGGPSIVLRGVTIYERTGGVLSSMLKADSARAVAGGWEMSGATRFLRRSGTVEPLGTIIAAPNVRPDQFTLAQVDGDELPFLQLRAAIADLEAAGRPVNALKGVLWHKISGPLSAILMPLLGAVAAFGLARSGKLFIRAIFGMALGFAYFVADNFALAMGDLGAYSPFLAAWGPFILFALIGEMILIRTEE
ncbi:MULTISPECIES: LPS export ABC transporter permease LptG [unclassified Sphingopyxis]|uniref:LPS export ABC transporter permease LptG n=1 Tax=unclassified Sphingopyxis TaxID=2614943 RepID=UPI00285B8536|nr:MULTISPECIES: LPS export ABC transporter permease LptG [unclassified Sphingopyxis]MDR6834415.1 lipopolysaccharide export system permease protein [Sphingopyxis sp. BE122]MDR7226684.1 lipopolysaccharide export system permease protein [Sphingopyxis sp. BE259]